MMNDLLKLWDNLNESIPNGSQEFEQDGVKYSINKEDGYLSVKVEKNNDPKIKDIVISFKEKLEDLDDDLFIELFEDLKKEIDVNRFSNLLTQDQFTVKEADEVRSLINQSVKIIRAKLQDKIEDLVETYEKF